jgi:putative addiction module component
LVAGRDDYDTTGRPLQREYTSRMQADEILAQALSLPRRERARVTEQLLLSLEEPDDDVAAAWVSELGRRSREVAQGTAQLVPGETACAEIVAELTQRRARRSSC